MASPEEPFDNGMSFDEALTHLSNQFPRLPMGVGAMHSGNRPITVDEHQLWYAELQQAEREHLITQAGPAKRFTPPCCCPKCGSCMAGNTPRCCCRSCGCQGPALQEQAFYGPVVHPGSPYPGAAL